MTSTSQSPASSPFALPDVEFAKRLDRSKFPANGILNFFRGRKTVQVDTGTKAVFLDSGSYVDELGPGKHRLDGFFERLTNPDRTEDIEVILVEDSVFSVRFGFERVRVKDDYPLDVALELDVELDDPETFYGSMMSQRRVVTATTLQQELRSPIRDDIEVSLVEYDPQDLYGNAELKQQLKAGLSDLCRRVFAENGVHLVRIRSFDFDDGRSEIREGKKAVENRSELEEVESERAELDMEARERETEDTVHETTETLRREVAEMSAGHELEKQEQSHEHELEATDVEHEEEKEIKRTHGEVQRRELEHEQDVEEMQNLMDLKKAKEKHKLDVEKERLKARDGVDIQTLASVADSNEELAELAKMAQASDLTPEQLEALGAQESDGLAKARQEASRADLHRERVEDQKEFREELQDSVADTMDRMESTMNNAMDNMGETAKAAAEDTSDNVIVSGNDGGNKGDTTIVQGGAGPGAESNEDPSNAKSGESMSCPNCGTSQATDNAFCLDCGATLS